MKKIVTSVSLLFLSLQAITQCCSGYSCTVIKLPPQFDRGVQISSLAWLNDTLIMPAEKYPEVFFGHIVHNPAGAETGSRDSLVLYSSRYRTGMIESLEGITCSDKILCTDEGKEVVYKSDRTFKDTASLKINLRPRDDTYKKIDSKTFGFEGIAAINDTSVYLLLESVQRGNRRYAVLYIGTICGNGIVIKSKRHFSLDSMGRYCDLYYDRSGTLYLLHTAYTDSSHNYYLIESLTNEQIDSSSDGSTIRPDTVCDITITVREQKRNNYNTNMEGLTMDNRGNFYVISDNCQCDSNSYTSIKKQGRTLLLRISRK